MSAVRFSVTNLGLGRHTERRDPRSEVNKKEAAAAAMIRRAVGAT